MLNKHVEDLAIETGLGKREVRRERQEVSEILTKFSRVGHVELILNAAGDILIQGVCLPKIAAKELKSVAHFSWKKCGSMQKCRANMHFISAILLS